MQDLSLGIHNAKRLHALLGTFSDQTMPTQEIRVRSIGSGFGAGDENFVEDYDSTADMEPLAGQDVGLEELCPICNKNPVEVEHNCGAKMCRGCLDDYNGKYGRLYGADGGGMVCPKCTKDMAISESENAGPGKKEQDEDYIRL
jgi:hypothetical protein